MDAHQIITRDYHTQLLLLHGRLMAAPAAQCRRTVFIAPQGQHVHTASLVNV